MNVITQVLWTVVKAMWIAGVAIIVSEKINERMKARRNIPWPIHDIEDQLDVEIHIREREEHDLQRPYTVGEMASNPKVNHWAAFCRRLERDYSLPRRAS